MADDVSVRFGAEIASLTQAIDGLKGQIGSISGVAERVTGSLKRIGELAGIAFSANAVKEFVSNFAELGETVANATAQLGASAEEVTQLRYIFQSSGSSMDALITVSAKLSTSMAKASEEGSKEAEAFRALGVSATDSNGKLKSIPTMLADIADAFQRTADGPEKLAIGTALMSRGFIGILPVLNKGREGFDEWIAAAERAGVVMSGPMVTAFAATDDKIDELKASFEGLGIRIFSALEPAIDWAVGAITTFIQSIDEEKIRSALAGVTEVASTIISVVGQFAIEVAEIVQAIIAKLQEYSTTVANVASAAGIVLKAVSGNAVGAGGDLINMLTGVNEALNTSGAASETWASRFSASIDGLRRRLQLSLLPDLITKEDRDAAGNHPGTTPPAKLPTLPTLDYGPAGKDQLGAALAAAGRELSAIQARTRALGMGAAAAAAYTEAEKLRAIAVSAGVKLTVADKVAIDAQAQAIAAATQQLQYAQAVQGTLTDLAQQITDAFMSFDGSLGSLGAAFLKLGVQIAAAIVEALILDAILAALGLAMPTAGFGAIFAPIFGGGKAGGGPVGANAFYLVGEKGPEIFKPNQSGTIMPNAMAFGGGGQGGGDTHINVSFVNHGALNEGSIAAHARTIAKAVAKEWNGRSRSTRPAY